MTEREAMLLALLQETVDIHSTDVKWRRRAQELGVYTKSEAKIIADDMALRQRLIRRYIRGIRYERRRGES